MRAKLRGVQRNAAVVLGNAGIHDDIEVPTRARHDEELLVRKHKAWARRELHRLNPSAAS